MADFFLPVHGGKGTSKRFVSTAAAKSKKRPRSEKESSKGTDKTSSKSNRPVKRPRLDEQLESDSGESDTARVDFKALTAGPAVDADEAAESAYAKRKRLAAGYLNAMESALQGRKSRPDGIGTGRGYGPDLLSGSGSAGSDSGGSGGRADVDLGEELRKRSLRQSGQYQQRVASSLADASVLSDAPSASHRKHKLPATCLAVSADASTIVSGGKDCCLVRWDLGSDSTTLLRGYRGRPELGGHTAHVLAVALADDGVHLVSAGGDSVIRLWDLRTNAMVDSFTGHRGAVHALTFRQGTSELFSGGMDRVLKLWNVSDRAYVDSQFGHEGAIHSLDALARDRVVSGAEDGSVRVWKIAEQKNLQFKPSGAAPGAAEAVALISEAQFVAGARDGGLSVFTTSKRRPLCHVAADGAHGAGQWIASVAALHHTDLLASGAGAGGLRLWQLGAHSSSLELVRALPVSGFVNGIAFARSGAFVAAAVGSEHRMGRWWRVPGAKNGVMLWRLPIDTDAAAIHDRDE